MLLQYIPRKGGILRKSPKRFQKVPFPTAVAMLTVCQTRFAVKLIDIWGEKDENLTLGGDVSNEA